MKIQIDTERKVIQLCEPIKVSELFSILSEKMWDYTLETDVIINNQNGTIMVPLWKYYTPPFTFLTTCDSTTSATLDIK